MAKKCIIISPSDNVAVALENLARGGIYEGVTLTEDITKGHKFALRNIAAGEDIIKYGTPICSGQKECTTSCSEDPCEMFRKIRFPVSEFFPPKQDCGCN